MGKGKGEGEAVFAFSFSLLLEVALSAFPALRADSSAGMQSFAFRNAKYVIPASHAWHWYLCLLTSGVQEQGLFPQDAGILLLEAFFSFETNLREDSLQWVVSSEGF